MDEPSKHARGDRTLLLGVAVAGLAAIGLGLSGVLHADDGTPGPVHEASNAPSMHDTNHVDARDSAANGGPSSAAGSTDSVGPSNALVPSGLPGPSDIEPTSDGPGSPADDARNASTPADDSSEPFDAWSEPASTPIDDTTSDDHVADREPKPSDAVADGAQAPVPATAPVEVPAEGSADAPADEPADAPVGAPPTPPQPEFQPTPKDSRPVEEEAPASPPREGSRLGNSYSIDVAVITPRIGEVGHVATAKLVVKNRGTSVLRNVAVAVVGRDGIVLVDGDRVQGQRFESRIESMQAGQTFKYDFDFKMMQVGTGRMLRVLPRVARLVLCGIACARRDRSHGG